MTWRAFAPIAIGPAIAVLVACGSPRARDGDAAHVSEADAGVLDVHSARATVGALAIAVAQRRRDDVLRHFSVRDLALVFQPRRVLRVSRAIEERFTDEIVRRLFDDKSRLRALFVDLEVREATMEDREASVEARGKLGGLRFRVAMRGGHAKVVRIE